MKQKIEALKKDYLAIKRGLCPKDCDKCKIEVKNWNGALDEVISILKI